MGWDPVDPVTQDFIHMWQTNGAPPSLAFRGLALLVDISVLREPEVHLALLPGWSQYPEAEAMVAVAKVLGKQVIELNEGVFKGADCQEY